MTPLTLTRDGDGYHLHGEVGALIVHSVEPLSAEAAERYCALLGRAAVVVDLPPGDPMNDLGRGAR